MDEVRDWLEGEERDYAAGVALYQVHGTSAVVRRLLAYGETDFTRGKLEQALQQLVASAPPVPTPVAKAPAAAPAVPASVAVDPQRRDWFAERNYLHAQLPLVATDAERRVMALRILDLADLIHQSYQAEAGHNLDTSRPQPGQHLATVTDAGEIRRLLANLRPQRTKLKKRPDRAPDLLQVEADIALLESKL